MKVSVIITTYRRPHYLREAIESVLAQNFEDFELIVVNDDPLGEETERIVLSYNDPRIRYIRNEKNLGGAKSLNIALDYSQGEYIAILDDDDAWVSKDKLEKQASFLDKNLDYIIVGTSSITVESKTEKEISKDKGWQEIKNTKNFLFFRVPFAHSSVLYRKEGVLRVGGYSESFPRGKDLDLYFKIAKFGKFGFLPECIIKHREVSNAERNIIETRYMDAIFQRRVLWRHRENNLYFWLAYFKISIRCFLFALLKISPFPYKIYRKIRYS